MDELPICQRLRDAANAIAGADASLGDADACEQAAALIRAQHEALKRAETLLQAAFDLIDKSYTAQSVIVFYDETDCDGLCLMQDCETAIEDARAALAQAREG